MVREVLYSAHWLTAVRAASERVLVADGGVKPPAVLTTLGGMSITLGEQPGFNQPGKKRRKRMHVAGIMSASLARKAGTNAAQQALEACQHSFYLKLCRTSAISVAMDSGADAPHLL